jgi:hypothetical protein
MAFAPTHIFGICFGVSEKHFDTLESVAYPLLYWNDAKLSILYGPLLLVNQGSLFVDLLPVLCRNKEATLKNSLQRTGRSSLFVSAEDWEE